MRLPESRNPAFIGKRDTVPVVAAPGVMVMTEQQEKHVRAALKITGSRMLDDVEVRRP